VLKNVQAVLSIELLCASQGLDFAGTMNPDAPLKPGKGTEAGRRCVRGAVRHLDDDRFLYEDIQKSLSLILDGTLLRTVERAVGRLQ
jgi:histidine ammonia-lyase